MSQTAETKIAETRPTDQELADVVIAAKIEDKPFVPWYVTLRPWLFCLAFLLVAELATRAYFDFTLCLQKERFDNYPSPASENAFVAQMRRDTAYKVVTIGDSTVVGAALLKPDQSIPRYLEEALRGALPGREIHVWNFSVAGARAPDMLLPAQKSPGGQARFYRRQRQLLHHGDGKNAAARSRRQRHVCPCQNARAADPGGTLAGL